MREHIYKIILTLLMISSNAFAQDLIVMKNGEEINAKITEFGSIEVKYKKFTNIDGPTYVINKSEVVFVKYQNGEKEIFEKTASEKTLESNSSEYLKIGSFGRLYKGDEKINKEEFLQILSTNNKAFNNYKSGLKSHNIGRILIFSGVGIFGYSVYKALDESKLNILYGGSAISTLFIIGGGVFSITGSVKVRNAVKTYNKSKGMVLNLDMNSNGIGLALQF